MSNNSVMFSATLKSLVSNIVSFKSESLLPVFEAVVNSIQAIEETENIKNKTITIRILRNKQTTLALNENAHAEIVGFEIEDNGIGFNDVCYKAFENYGTEYKLEKGCKGIGRFTWLKAFDKAVVDSIYYGEDKGLYRRHFSFTDINGVNETSNSKDSNAKFPKTVVKLEGFKKEYKDQPSAYKRASTVAQRILEHTMSYFISGDVPNIIVQDVDSDDEDISLSDLYDAIKNNIEKNSFLIKDIDFTLHHIKLYKSHQEAHNFVFCAHNRDVVTEPINKTIGSDLLYDENDNKFIYAAYITSSYLDKHVEPNRLSFNIPENNPLDKEKYPVSLAEIKEEIITRSKQYLSEYLDAIANKKQHKVEVFLKNTPWFKYLPTYCPEIYKEIQVNTSDTAMNELFYKYKGRAELSVIKKHKKLLRSQPKSLEELDEKYNEVKEKINNLGRDTLAEYILYRKMIIELLDKKIKLNEEQKMSNENIVHDIIFPRYSTSDKIRYEDHNLWLIDDRLAFHNYAKSESALKNKKGNDDRADIAIFSLDDKTTRTATDISIVEFKKPQRKHFDTNPTSQVFRYVRLIKEGSVKTSSGRPLNVNDCTRFYCYVICDLTQEINIFAEDGGYSKLNNELGYYNYNSILKSHVGIIDFDKIVSDAEMRNKIFFDKLGVCWNK